MQKPNAITRAYYRHTTPPKSKSLLNVSTRAKGENMTLHNPCRATALQSLEAHLNCAASISRAIWELLENGSNINDERTLAALRQLADSAADHSSAALFQFNSGERL